MMEKALQKINPLRNCYQREIWSIRLSQHIGAPANPVVAVGDRVLKGQKIAEAGGFVSAPIYASVSGTVKAIEPHFNATGCKGELYCCGK